MNPPPSNTILNGPSGELTMAFKDSQKSPNNIPSNNQNVRPPLQRNDSRIQGGPPQFQGQPRPFPQGPPQQPGQAPQFRPPNLQQQIQQQILNQQQRFSQPGVVNPQGTTGQPGQGGPPLFRPQQRFVAVNPPGTVRPNFRTPVPGAQGAPGPQAPLRQRPPGPPLQKQPSFAGTGGLPTQRSQESISGGELQRSATLEVDTVPHNNDIHYEEKEEIAQKMPTPTESPVQHVASPSPQPQPETQPQTQQQIQSAPPPSPSPSPTAVKPQTQSPSPQNAQIPQPNDGVPPNTLQLTSSLESKNSSSPSPQPESVIEVKKSVDKPTEAKPKSHDHKPPKVPKTPTRGGSTARAPSRNKKEGDNDSGVDESTQGADNSTNGDRTPRKATRNGSRTSGGATPTKHRSFSRGSRSPMMSPDSQPGTPGPTEKKKIPMNKVQVGAAPSPNLKVVKSKIGSLANASHKPGGGNVKIETKKIDVSKAQSRIGAKNENYTPTGGDKKITSQKLQWNAKSKIGSLDNASHKPKGGEKKIETVKLDFKDKAKPKVGSKDNIQYVPGGGDVKTPKENGLMNCNSAKMVKSSKENLNETLDQQKSAGKQHNVKIIDRKIDIQADSKIGSLENVKHRPGGGEKKIFDDKEYLRQMSGGTNDNNSMCGSQNSLPSQHSQHSDTREPISDENLNREN